MRLHMSQYISNASELSELVDFQCVRIPRDYFILFIIFYFFKDSLGYLPVGILQMLGNMDCAARMCIQGINL